MALELRLSESSCCAAAEALAPGEADLQSLQRRLLLCRRMVRGGGQSLKTKTQSLAPADSPHHYRAPQTPDSLLFLPDLLKIKTENREKK